MAVEPSAEMITQRGGDAHPCVQGSAEELPFRSNSFSHALTILSMHHWSDRKRAFAEINRVATDRFIAVTWNPEADPFWLTRDYFPEIYETDRTIFPYRSKLEQFFDDVVITPLMIPEDCQDGFLAAYWKRPEAYLNPVVRNSISTFAKLDDASVGLHKLAKDLETGAWGDNNQEILKKSSLDVGYVIVSAKIRN